MAELVVEDGTGKVDANAYAETAYVAAYATLRGLIWSGTLDQQKAAVVLATDFLSNELRFDWRGVRYSSAQRLPFPRIDVSERNGIAITNNVISWRLKESMAALSVAVRNGAVLQADIPNGGAMLQMRKVDVLERQWFKPSSEGSILQTETVRTEVLGYLWPLLRGNDKNSTPYVNTIDEELPFLTGGYDYL